MATEGKENPYEGAELGTGGKFRKRPFRRTQTTPYDRPPTSLRNPTRNNNGWLSKVVDPAHRLITYSAHALFSSLFRKRLPPPPPHSQPYSSETEQEMRDNHPEEAAFQQVVDNSFGKQQGAAGENNVHINCSGGGGLTELEKLLRQKTFTRSEIDHLTALMRSRTVDAPGREEEKCTKVPSEPILPREQKEEYPKTPTAENGIENHLALTPHVTLSVPIEDVALPAELAKAYMGSRPSKGSSSMLGIRSPVLREDPTLLKNENLPHKSPIMSVVPTATRHSGVHENGFVTSRLRGRSAIYSMARTPYARIYPTSTLKRGRLDVEDEPSSSTQSALDHDMLSGSKQGAVKRRSSALDNDIGSVGPIRRIRHKSNLLYSTGSTLPLSGSSLSIARTRVGVDDAQQPSPSMQKHILLDEVNHSHTKLSEENVDDTIPSMGFPSLPSKSSEMASKILHQLDKIVSPKEKSSELRLPTVSDKSPMRVSPSMLHGRPFQSMETVDSSKLLDTIKDNKLDGTLGNLSASAQKLASQVDKVENGPLKFLAPSDGFVPAAVTDADATKSRNQVFSSAKSVDSSMIKSFSYPPQKKSAFHMSAHEDSLDLDDDAYPNGAVPSVFPVEKETASSTAMAEKTTSGTEAIAQENPPPLMASKSSTIGVEAHVGTAGGSKVAEKVDLSTSIKSSIPDQTCKPVTVAVTEATETSVGSDKPASPNGSIANPSVFNFGNKVVSSTESAASAPLKELTKSGPIFGSEKVSSRGPGTSADAPLLNFSTDGNVSKASQNPFTSSSVAGEYTFMKFGTASDSKLGSSASSTTVAGAAVSVPKVRESDNTDTGIDRDTGFSVKSSELVISSAASTSLLTTPTSIFTVGHSNVSLASSPSFLSPFTSLASNNFTSQNVFSSSSLAASSNINATAASTGTSMTTSTPAIFASSNSSSSTPAVASSSSTAPVFKFGFSSAPSTGFPVSSSGSEPKETKNREDAGNGNLGSTAFGSSSAAVGSTGSGIFCFNSSAMTTVNSQTQGSVIGASNGSVTGAQASPGTSVFATSTQSQSVPFSLSASSPSFGLTGNTAFSSGSSFLSSSIPATNTAFSSGSSLFSSSSSATDIFNSGTTFGPSTSASSTAANSVNSNSGTNSSLFSWQPKSPFSSAFGSSSSSSGFSFGTSTSVVPTGFSFGTSTSSVASSGFSFGTSTASVASTSSPTMCSSTTGASTSSPQFSLTSAAATTSTQPAFGSPNPVFTFGSVPVNNDQTSMEDSMAEDTVQATTPATPTFGQQPAPFQSNFLFGASAPSGGSSPFQFGSQQSIASQNPSPFQASGSLEFTAGGSFSLGTGGGDKSSRKFLKVKHRQRKK